MGENRNTILEKEIDLIQSCINRMAQNSFIVKGWTITLITVALALLPEKFNVQLLCIVGLISTFCFWYLDGFFLKIEKLYRWKYEWVILHRKESELFSYDLNPYNKEMWNHNNNGEAKKEPSVFRVMFTKTLTPIYLPLIVLEVVFLVCSFLQKC